MHYRPHVSVIVPTYCEAGNLAELTQRVSSAMSKTGRSFEILIVDDNSPDDTPRVCQALARKYPLRLVVREHERGLSSAVIRGMREAAGELLVVMDADLSHPPEVVPDLVALLQRPEVDFVIGSRYVAGGSTAADWGFLRRLNSRGATWLARGLTRVRDPLAGFFGLRRSRFLAAEPQLDGLGFKIGLELMVKARCQHVVETPIRFANRRRGTSKLTWRQQFQYLQHLARLYRFQFQTRGQAETPSTPSQPLPSATRRAA